MPTAFGSGADIGSADGHSPAHPIDRRKRDPRAGKYLIFKLGAEEFGIPVLQIREILSMQEITAVPNTPEHIKGVINLRGKIIPVVDLRLKFNMSRTAASMTTCIVVVQVQRDREHLNVGVIVDNVLEVANLPSGEIEDGPDFGEAISTEWLLGIARKQTGVRILLHVDNMLSARELEGLGSVTNQKNN